VMIGGRKANVLQKLSREFGRGLPISEGLKQAL